MTSKWYIFYAGVVVFVALGTLVITHNAWLAAADSLVAQSVVAARTPGLTAFMKSVTLLGTSLVYFVVLAAGSCAYKVRGWKYLLIALVSLALAQLVRVGINVLVHRPRPPRADWLVNANFYSFPSGHTVMAAVGFGLAAWLIWLTDRRLGTVCVGAAVVVALLVGASRIYLGVHWTSDVLGSLAFAAAWLALTLIVAARV